MGTKSSAKKIRYAVIGLGHIAQVAVLPAFLHAKNNSELTALVSGDPEKLAKLGKRYKVPNLYSYAEYADCLQSGEIDAVYIALPNDMHRDYAIKAARAGIHVLSEKPLAVTEQHSADMIAAAEKAGVKLMTAYRLHNEEANLRAIEIVRSGKIGDPRYFTSAFSFQLQDPDNIRLKKKRGGGTLYDIGVYCINAARYIFQSDPIEAVGFTANSGDRRFNETEEMAGALLRFPEDRLATFICSFGAGDAGDYTVVGTKGSLKVSPAYEYETGLGYTLTINGKEQEKKFPQRDQFAAEIIYFSDCIMKRRDVEPSGLEGLADVRIVEALYESARTGKVIRFKSFAKKPRPSAKQIINKPAAKKPPLVNVKSPTD